MKQDGTVVAHVRVPIKDIIEADSWFGMNDWFYDFFIPAHPNNDAEKGDTGYHDFNSVECFVAGHEPGKRNKNRQPKDTPAEGFVILKVRMNVADIVEQMRDELNNPQGEDEDENTKPEGQNEK